MRFLHIADVHLGCTRYQLPESQKDFFDAWIDVLDRYAVDEKVDFVIMCGDFFHKRTVPPETMDYAVEGLTRMRDAGIPVITIEGNHDQRHSDSEFSWLRSLAKWGLVILLEPTRIDGKLTYEPWDERRRRGGFVDIGKARIFGSDWFGASTNWAVPMLTGSIQANRRDGAFHILMLHTDVEGHQMHPIPALTVEALKELRTAVDYVGLGHTHKRYEIDNWAFNPGSIEITNISEYRETRGAFIVDVGKDNTVSARHVDDYLYRPFQQLAFNVAGYADTKKITESVLDLVRSDARRAEADKPKPIIEITLRGQLGFPNSLLEIQAIRDSAREITDALHVRVKNHTLPVDMDDASEIPDDGGRERLERGVVNGLVARDERYRARAEEIADAVIGAKRMALGDEPPAKIADFISQKACSTK
ncbi:MAG: DNA repair exonuclease [Acidobacteria bacterium]|nr:DNA repair exonuclease [Acidobacteriota bacterium]MCW5950147.1 DNA repair exonuclease [Pyrinomonadaceae bacterium]